MATSGIGILKAAVNAANVNRIDLKFETEVYTEAATSFENLKVIYTEGNEFLNLRKLFETVHSNSDIQFFELRGRGADEVPTLVLRIKVDGQITQMIYPL